MSQPNHQIKKHVGLVGAICGSLLLSVPAIAQMNPSTKPSPTSASSEMCVPNADATSSSTEGTSSVNSNRNTPTTDRASNTNTESRMTASASSANSDRNMQTSVTRRTTEGSSSANSNRNAPTPTTTGNQRATSTDITRRTTEGSSSANSNRNAPTPTTTGNQTPPVSETLPSGTVSEEPSSRRDPAALREQNNTDANAEMCSSPTSTDRNMTAPSSSSPNRDNQMRRDNSRITPLTPQK